MDGEGEWVIPGIGTRRRLALTSNSSSHALSSCSDELEDDRGSSRYEGFGQSVSVEGDEMIVRWDDSG
jgi:hypothetical protein